MRKMLVTSHQNTKKNLKNLWLDHIAQSRHYNFQQEVESQHKFHHFLVNSTSWFKYEELIEDWLNLTVLDETKRSSTEESTCRRHRNVFL